MYSKTYLFKKRAIILIILIIPFLLSCSKKESISTKKKNTSTMLSNQKDTSMLSNHKKDTFDNKKRVKSQKKEQKMEKLEISGNWLGILVINEKTKLKITFTFNLEKGLIKAFMGSPDQMAMKIDIDRVEFKDNSLKLEIKKANIEYKAIYKNNKIIGTFKQNGMSFPLELKRVKSLDDVVKKYKQTPKKPYPYTEEEITFKNSKAKITLSGTFTYPKVGKNFTTIVLISGSGPNDRNETAMGHFLLLSDYLTRKGYATLRFDKRGIKKSTGNYSKATTLNFAEDVEFAVDYLKTRKEVNIKKIGLIGHSEGGLIAPIVASKRDDIAFIILMAGTGVSGEEILLKQNYDIAKAAGVTEEDLEKSKVLNKKIYDLIKTEKDPKILEEKIVKLEPKLKNQISTLKGKWFKKFLTLEPKTYLQKVTIPILAINGDKDLQVSAKENLEEIEKALKVANNKNYTIKYFKGLNHLFQTCKTGSPSEYVKLDEIIAPQVLEFISNWLKELKF